MSDNTSQSYKNRIERFKKFIEIVKEIPDYKVKSSSLTVTGLNETAKKLETLHEQTKKQEEETSSYIRHRKNLYTGKKTGLMHRLTPINMYLKGEEDTPYYLPKRLQNIFNHMRGKKKRQTSDSQSNSQKVSTQNINYKKKDRKQFNCTFGGRYDDFKSIINLISNLGARYSPNNELITLEALNQLRSDIAEANRKVDTLKARRKKKKAKRRNSFKSMKRTVQKVKYNIGSQFGTESEEYSMVKDFKV